MILPKYSYHTKDNVELARMIAMADIREEHKEAPTFYGALVWSSPGTNIDTAIKNDVRNLILLKEIGFMEASVSIS